MVLAEKWNYDYDSRCECSDDDRCGCTFPNNMGHGFVVEDQPGNARAVLCRPVMVGQQAYNFTAPAVLADGTIEELFNFFDYIAESYALLLFYLADFSAVCPLEIVSFNQTYEEFAKRGVKVAAVSVDSVSAHAAWRKLSFADGGIGQVNIPLISDLNKIICGQYGVLRTDGMAQRSTFLIDKNYTVRYQAVYDRKMERNAEETLRVIDKLLISDKAECKGFQCRNRSNAFVTAET